jgi:hypothetical protein
MGGVHLPCCTIKKERTSWSFVEEGWPNAIYWSSKNGFLGRGVNSALLTWGTVMSFGEQGH